MATQHQAHRSINRRRRAGAFEHEQPVRSLLHYEARGFGNRISVEPPDRGSPRRHPDARESKIMPRLRSSSSIANLTARSQRSEVRSQKSDVRAQDDTG